MGSVPESSPAVPWFRNTRPSPRPSRRVSGIVFESSTGCIETTPGVANTLAKIALRYLSRHLDTCPPDLGSGGATRGGSSPSSSTELKSLLAASELGKLLRVRAASDVTGFEVDFERYPIVRHRIVCFPDEGRVSHGDVQHSVPRDTP